MTLIRLLMLLFCLVGTAAHAERVVVQTLTDTDIQFDPVYASDASALVVIDSLFDTLVSWDADGQLVAAQADRWDLSEDQLVYTFHLGANNLWTDGSPVVAQDFVAAFRRFVDPATDDRIVLRYLLDSVQNATAIGAGEMAPETLGVRAIDDHILEITVAAPTSYFLEILAWPGLAAVPSHLLGKEGSNWTDPGNLVSNGAYKINTHEPGHLVLDRHEAFRLHHEPDRLEFLFAKSQDDMMKLLANDEVDIVLALPQKEVAALQSGDWVKEVALETSPATTYLVFNTAKPPFNDVNLRRAIDLVVDRDVLHTAQDDYEGVVATTFTSPSLFRHVTPVAPELPPYDERLAEARALFAAAGYDDANPLPLRLIRRTASPQSLPAFFGIRSMISQLPVSIEAVELERTDLLERLSSKDFDAAILTWQADYSDPMTFLGLFREGGFANFSGWASAPYQTLLTQALETPDRKAREDIYLKLENLIRDEVPIVPLRHSSISVVWSKNLKMPKLVNGILYPKLVSFLE